MRDETDSAKIATIYERTNNIQNSLNSHINDDNQRFERVFTYLQTEFSKMNARFDQTDDKIEGRIKPLETKISTLWDEKNNREGAIGMGRFVAGIVGGAVVAMAEFIKNIHGGGGN